MYVVSEVCGKKKLNIELGAVQLGYFETRVARFDLFFEFLSAESSGLLLQDLQRGVVGFQDL